jgi:hypothetical protein
VFLGDGKGGGPGAPIPGVGIWQTGDGENGVGSSNGHGGGGSSADDCLVCSDDGGGDGGGQGGGPGLVGQGGGGSFGILLVNSAGARLDHATITASD